ncbi:MAG: sporulation protein YqfC [Limnochordales bacterium]|nr:sporulation protein YqfC [Limnochordales bacterium]
MGRQRGSVAERLVRALELPQDIVFNLPKTTLIGDVQMLVENHQGLLKYTPREIRIRTTQGELVVTGSRLAIGSILPQELVVDGRILQVQLHR